MGRVPSQWEQIVAENPQHSHWYVQRFRTLAAQGRDLDGEARLIDAMASRGARILDAGCGPGRLGGYLHRQGHQVVGVDVDPVLIEAAEQDWPGPHWIVGDLAQLHLARAGEPDPFDLIVAAGNVLTFLHPGTRVEVLRRFGLHLAPGGRAVVGFGAGRGYAFEQFDTDVHTAGLRVGDRFSTWDLRPFDDGSDFLVAVLERAS